MMLEEKARVVSVDSGYATIESIGTAGCGGCSASASCGTASLASLFGRRSRRLRVLNDIGALPGDQVIVHLNSSAMLLASMLIYLLPLLMLLAGAIFGEWLAKVMGLENSEIVAISIALTAALLAFRISRMAITSPRFSSLLRPVLHSRC
jgi:sigma-E factor negative regulatory protein RseC